MDVEGGEIVKAAEAASAESPPPPATLVPRASPGPAAAQSHRKQSTEHFSEAKRVNESCADPTLFPSWVFG